MTCIVGFIEGKTVFIGGDSAGVSGLDMTVRADEKVFEGDGCIMGFTTSFRMGQLLRYSLSRPDHPEGMPDLEYMATRFVDAVRKCLKKGGYAKTEEEREIGGTFLVGYRGGLFNIQDDYQVGQPHDIFDAVGCGYQVARGALHTTQDLDVEPKDKVLAALLAAERFCAGVRRPFVVLSTAGESWGDKTDG